MALLPQAMNRPAVAAAVLLMQFLSWFQKQKVRLQGYVQSCLGTIGLCTIIQQSCHSYQPPRAGTRTVDQPAWLQMDFRHCFCLHKKDTGHCRRPDSQQSSLYALSLLAWPLGTHSTAWHSKAASFKQRQQAGNG